MEYELINPSDPYTFVAEDFETAALAVFCLSTAYAAKPKEGTDEVPIFLFGGAKEWFQEKFGRTPDEGLIAKKNSVADALQSVMLGGFKDRKRYEIALSLITDEKKKEEFAAMWQDDCTSCNNIGSVAHEIAKQLLTD